MLQLLSPSYLFDTLPGSEFKYFWVCIVFFLALIVFGQYLRAYIKNSPHKKILKRLYPGVAGKFLTLALFGYLFLFFRYENIPYLAMRFFLVLIIVWALYYIGMIVYKFVKNFPEKVAKKERTETHDKYLPKQKKKKKRRR